MLHSIAVWLLFVAFVGAGLFNAIGMRAAQDDFARWGYPHWWCRVTVGVEIVAAALIAFPAGRSIGMALGAVIIAVAAVTILRRREFSHIAPLGVFAALLALVSTTSWCTDSSFKRTKIEMGRAFSKSIEFREWRWVGI